MDASNDNRHFAKISAGLWLNPKWRQFSTANPAAAVLWINAITFSVNQHTDGVVPSYVAKGFLGGSELELKDLADAKFITLEKDGGFVIHDFLKYQSSRKQIAKRHELKREAGRKGAQRHWKNNLNPRLIDPKTGRLKDTGDSRTST